MMVSVESIAVAISVIVVVSLAVWCLYTLVKITGMAKEVCSNELPYKVEPAEQLAVPHKPIEWTFANAPEKQELRNIQFDPVQPPKRKYTKRKPAAKKKITQKKTSKSK